MIYYNIVVVLCETQNVNEWKGSDKGFTYMTLKTWSGSAKMREVETH